TLLLVNGKGKELWAFYLTEGPATEAEVEAFIKLAKSLKPSPSKKVFVSPNGINMDGAILAKEAKLLLWDRNWIEMIFEFFEKKRPSSMQVKDAPIRAMAS
ncbi:MAG: hypothetical protein HY589_04980, partial [Candidatus Omnitrophica bacterium]|nr:hypothetical protein [Candidatus Omnitrophota bacterium]